MKRLLFLVFIGFIALMIYMSEYEPAGDPLPLKLEHSIKQARMMEYQDDDYDYVIHYPQFFEQTDDSLMEKGSCRFTFWKDSVEVVLSAFVEHDLDSLNAQDAVKKYAHSLHATYQRVGDDFFILSGSLHSDTGQITGRRFYAKFVKHRKLWFVQSLTYPENCEPALKRLFIEIDKWKVWNAPH